MHGRRDLMVSVERTMLVCEALAQLSPPTAACFALVLGLDDGADRTICMPRRCEDEAALRGASAPAQAAGNGVSELDSLAAELGLM
jgi:hypothetical protein